MNAPRSRFPLVIVLLVIVIAALIGGGVYLRPRFESEPPQITVSPGADVIGLAPLEIQVTDKGTGLKSVTATLSQGGTEQSHRDSWGPGTTSMGGTHIKAWYSGSEQ